MSKTYHNIITSMLLFFIYRRAAMAQKPNVEFVPYGDMDNWLVRNITESAIIGGQTKKLYEIAPKGEVTGAKAYSNAGGSPWATSNVLATVSGIIKTNTTVFPEPRGNGYCARLETKIEKCVVLGIVDIKVLAAGSVFLGNMHEPIKNTSNPQSKLSSGIPFTKKPVSLIFDYKVKLSGEENRVKQTGFSKPSTVKGVDMPMVCLYLQKRWEDAGGNIFAKRVGTMAIRFDKTTGWINQAQCKILYGDISGRKDFKSYMGLVPYTDPQYAVNSTGKSVPIREMAWGTENDEVTHVVLQFASSHGGPYIGSPGNTLWIDNVKFGY